MGASVANAMAEASPMRISLRKRTMRFASAALRAENPSDSITCDAVTIVFTVSEGASTLPPIKPYTDHRRQRVGRIAPKS
jgi:hypothetical protein